MALFSSARPPRTILVAAPRRIGDVRLTTPPGRSRKARWPEAQIDMLVFRGTEGVLEHNPDVRRVIVVAQRARFRERLRAALSIWRRYDLACAALSSDRPRFYSWFAGRKRVGLVDPNRVTWLTRMRLDGIAINHHESAHTVVSTLALAPVIGIEPVSEVVAPGIGDDPARRARFDAWLAESPAIRDGQPLVVLHPYPMFRYKQWRLDGWVEMIDWLRGQGVAVALSGGPADREREYAEQVAAEAGGDVLNLGGRPPFGAGAELVRRARLFIGPDTGATHVAAATGTDTIALFGPSDPVRWGPWPQHWPPTENPWALRGSGRPGNVWLLQGEGDCVPCRHEGCERHVDSRSDCLAHPGAQRVKAAAAEMLGLNPPDPAGVIIDTSRLDRARRD
ncbi:glycosyltransferase family 9 protein [Burkholderia vietnamiensis]|uniref:glycosyltransferase family 9 protein n=1 Tax=Burkholderia vietnamiensis TaxID=60552 RepID=UPI000D78B1F5|nr:glycosyltransferase family 9 protein [Burkholderia vietnamiensis]